jgi:hypothetical protein
VKGKEKPPVPRYHYKLATVVSPLKACHLESALRAKLDESGLSFFAICHQGGNCDVMGDSGPNPMNPDALRDARAVAAKLIGA